LFLKEGGECPRKSSLLMGLLPLKRELHANKSLCIFRKINVILLCTLIFLMALYWLISSLAKRRLFGSS